MHECLIEKYRESPRHATYLTIDHPILLWKVCTWQELGASLITGGFTLLALPYLYSFLGFVVAGVVFLLLRAYRLRVPKGFLQHYAWASRTLSRREIPRLFTRRFQGRFGP
jgi:hypothetical protein